MKQLFYDTKINLVTFFFSKPIESLQTCILMALLGHQIIALRSEGADQQKSLEVGGDFPIQKNSCKQTYEKYGIKMIGKDVFIFDRVNNTEYTYYIAFQFLTLFAFVFNCKEQYRPIRRGRFSLTSEKTQLKAIPLVAHFFLDNRDTRISRETPKTLSPGSNIIKLCEALPTFSIKRSSVEKKNTCRQIGLKKFIH